MYTLVCAYCSYAEVCTYKLYTLVCIPNHTEVYTIYRYLCAFYKRASYVETYIVPLIWD